MQWPSLEVRSKRLLVSQIGESLLQKSWVGLNPGEGDGPEAEGAMRQEKQQESESLMTERSILFPMSHSEKSGMISAENSCQPYSSLRCEG